jgi:hypothetical protein
MLLLLLRRRNINLLLSEEEKRMWCHDIGMVIEWLGLSLFVFVFGFYLFLFSVSFGDILFRICDKQDSLTQQGPTLHSSTAYHFSISLLN